MKIGIFGGTFDPFHMGHLAIAKKALKKVDKVVIVPTICNYYRQDKRYLFTFDEKVQIIEEMILGVQNVEIDTIEKGQDSKWRTINTVEYFKQKYPNDEIVLIIGEDSLADFHTWFRYEDILGLCTLLVANRGNKIRRDIPYDVLNIGKSFEESSSSRVRNALIEELIDLYLGDKQYYGY